MVGTVSVKRHSVKSTSALTNHCCLTLTDRCAQNWLVERTSLLILNCGPVLPPNPTRPPAVAAVSKPRKAFTSPDRERYFGSLRVVLMALNHSVPYRRLVVTPSATRPSQSNR